jgi:ABC-type transporter Mla subunit MlaD
MDDLVKKTSVLLAEKRDLLKEIIELCSKELQAALEDKWAEFNSLAENFKTVSEKIDKLDILIGELIAGQEIQSRKLEELDKEIQTLVLECLELQKKTANVVEQKKAHALSQLKVLETRNDAVKAYNRPSSYHKSIPKFVDDKK